MGQAFQQVGICTKVCSTEHCCEESINAGSGKVEHQLLAAIVNGETCKAESLIKGCRGDLVNCRLQVPMSDGTYMCYSDGATPLHLACLLGHSRLVQALIDKRAEVHAADERGNTAMFYARRGHHEEIQRLLERRAVADTVPSLLQVERPKAQNLAGSHESSSSFVRPAPDI